MFRRYAGRNGSRQALLRLTDVISRLLQNAVIVLLILLLLSQLVIQNDTIRGLVTSADRWEGTRLE